MVEILLSFFAVIGIILLAIQFFDFLFYRKFNPKINTVVDLRNCDLEESVRILELLSGVRNRKSGKAATGKLIFLTKRNHRFRDDLLWHYIKIFDLDGIVVHNLEEEISKRIIENSEN
jgi:hypothetical protein